MNLDDLNSVCVCIDEYDSGEMHGRLYNAVQEEPIQFNSAITMVKCINYIFDNGDYPQATMRVRGFGKTIPVKQAPKKDDKAAFSDPRHRAFSRTNIRGKKATFGVKIMFRQNASWQGTLCWIEKNREESFRSVLELMMLIDSAFEAEQATAGVSKDEPLAQGM